MLPKIVRLLHQSIFADMPLGDLQNAIDQTRTSLMDAPGVSLANRPKLLLQLAWILTRQGNYQEALEAANEVLETSPAAIEAAQALRIVGIIAAEKDDFSTAETVYLQAANQARLLEDNKELARALYLLASDVLIPRGKFDLARSNIEEAHSICTSLGLKDWEWGWLRAHIHLLCGRSRRAREALDQLVNEFEPATHIAGGYYLLWARLAIDENELEKAHEYLRLGLRIATQTGVPDLNVWVRIEHSRYYRKSSQPATAREWAEDALQTAQRQGMGYFAALAGLEYAQACWENNEGESAQSAVAEAAKSLEQMGAAFDLAYAKYLDALWKQLASHPDAEASWRRAAEAITRGGYAFILEKEQENAFPLIAGYLRSAVPASRKAAESLMQNLAKVPPPALRIVTLGQFAVWKGRQLIPDRSWQKRKAGELFRYLLLQPNRSAGKEAILEALWPDYPLDSSSDLLHQATSALRRLLEPDLPDKFPSRYLSYEGEKIALQLPPGSIVDFEIFHQTLPAALRDRDSEHLQDSLSLYSGELFPSDRYAEWCDEPRKALSELYQEGLLALADLHFKNIQYADALDCCRQVMQLDPWNENAVFIAMQCYIELGTVTHALRIYLALEKALRDDLDIQPKPELRQLAAAIRSR
jgi:DNA-binding SARP family transcriptional activator